MGLHLPTWKAGDGPYLRINASDLSSGNPFNSAKINLIFCVRTSPRFHREGGRCVRGCATPLSPYHVANYAGRVGLKDRLG